MSLTTTNPPLAGDRPMAGTVLGHGSGKFPVGQLLGSSDGRNWSGLSAERRFHPAGDLPTFVPVYTEVALLVRGLSTVTRRAAGVCQRTSAARGTVWLCPAGLREDFITMSRDITEVLHVYLPSQPFVALANDHSSQNFSGISLCYAAGFRDPVLEGIAAAILSEMQAETSAGRILIESLACSLAARLLQSHSDISLKLPPPAAAEKGLDHRRLRRVLEFVEAHLENDISVEDLASTAALSRFHFARAFKAATGKTPRQHVSERRLRLAKSLLADGSRPLVGIALACSFSSQANFSRAFRRSTGLTPGKYRATATGDAERRTAASHNGIKQQHAGRIQP
jgi:AraC family transcriptional regulator